jgi:protein SCO1/2
MTTTKPPSRGAFIWGSALLAAMAFGLGLAAYLGGDTKPQSAQTQDGPGGPFTLIASNGKPFTLADVGGKPYAIYFGFTRCPDVCPTSLAKMARLRARMGKDGEKFAMLFVSVDPEHDKPKDIGQYVTLFGTPIIGLTGSEAQLAAIEKSYGVYVAKVPQPGGDYTIDHTASIYLMDAKGGFQNMIGHDESDDAALAKLKQLVG